MCILTNEYGLFIASSRRDANRPSWVQFLPPPPSFAGVFEGRLIVDVKSRVSTRERVAISA